MKRYYILFLLSALATVASAQSKKMTLADEAIEVTHYKVQRTGDEMVLSMHLDITSLEMESNQFIALTPQLNSRNGEVLALRPILIAGRKQEIVFQREGIELYPNGISVRRHNHTTQVVKYLQAVAYEPWMSGATLTMVEDLCGCGKQWAQNEQPLSRVDYHPEKNITLAFIEPEIEGKKVRKAEGKAFLDFPVNRTEINPSYRRNPDELRKIMASVDSVRNSPYTTITHIGIHGYASPEGSYSNNTRLAAGRAEALKEYVRLLYSFPESIFEVQSTPEDWEGLRRFVVESTLSEKEALLKVIDSQLHPDAKDTALKNQFSRLYKWMVAEWYPALRHSDYMVKYEVRPLTVEEARQVLITQPQLLSLQEVFSVALSYPTASPEYAEVMEKAVSLFPQDETANLNAAILALQRADYTRAAHYLAKAGNSPQADHARGVMALKQQQYEVAAPLLERAVRGGVKEAEANLAILHELQSI